MREFRDGHERLSARTSLFAECPDPALGKEILKKYEYNLCRVLKIQHSAKLLKKEKKPLPSARDPALGKLYKKPKNDINVHLQQKIYYFMHYYLYFRLEQLTFHFSLFHAKKLLFHVFHS